LFSAYVFEDFNTVSMSLHQISSILHHLVVTYLFDYKQAETLQFLYIFMHFIQFRHPESQNLPIMHHPVAQNRSKSGVTI